MQAANQWSEIFREKCGDSLRLAAHLDKSAENRNENPLALLTLSGRYLHRPFEHLRNRLLSGALFDSCAKGKPKEKHRCGRDARTGAGSCNPAPTGMDLRSVGMRRKLEGRARQIAMGHEDHGFFQCVLV